MLHEGSSNPYELMKDCFGTSTYRRKGHLPAPSDDNSHLSAIVAGLVILLVSALTLSPAECLQE